jgi:hypothetical protein
VRRRRTTDGKTHTGLLVRDTVHLLYDSANGGFKIELICWRWMHAAARPSRVLLLYCDIDQFAIRNPPLRKPCNGYLDPGHSLYARAGRGRDVRAVRGFRR